MTRKKFTLQKGFTLVETLFVAGIFAVIFLFSSFNLLKAQHGSAINNQVNLLIADIKSQQNKAMVGATEGRSSGDNYGIYIAPNVYTLFHGPSYNANDSANFSISADKNLSLSTTFPNASVIFLQSSGEVSGFTNGQNTITVHDTAGNEQKTILINRYGVVTGVN